MAKFFAAAILSWTLLGCAGVKTTSDPQGNPEIVIERIDQATLIALMHDEMFAREFYLKSQDAKNVVYGKSGSIETNNLYSPTYNAESELRITYTLLPESAVGGIRIKARSELIINPRTVMEQSTEPNQWDAVHQMRGVMKRIAQMAAQRRKSVK